MAKAPTQEKQVEAVVHINKMYSNFTIQMQQIKDRLLHIYEEVRCFEEPKLEEWSTSFKVNKMFEIENKVVPKIISRDPEWIVTAKEEGINSFLIGDPAEVIKKIEQNREGAKIISAYLKKVFKNDVNREKIRLWAKNMIRYGYGFVRPKWQYEVTRIKDGDTIKEDIAGEFPTIQVVNWRNLYFDPRYNLFEDMPSNIETVEGVRLTDLRGKKDYFNLDKIEDIIKAQQEFAKDDEGYADRIFQITGVQENIKIDPEGFTMKVYEGFFKSENEKNEKLVRMTEVCNVLIGYEEITQMRHVDARGFEDPEQYTPTGFIEPIMGLQQEMNFKKNSASEYINKSLNKERIWSPRSGIDPKQLNSRPGNVMVSTQDGQTALANIPELPQRDINPGYFNEQADFERQMQSLSFTIDIANRQNIGGETNTATGERIQFFESNQVINQIRKNFEQSLTQLAYKMLQETFENLSETDNIILKKEGSQEYWSVNKELLRNALANFEISIETGSTVLDAIEDRRQDAIAKYNLMLQAQQAGVPVDLTAGFKKIMSTFEDVNPDEIVKEELLQPMQQAGGGELPQEETAQEEVAELTQKVAGGDITN